LLAIVPILILAAAPRSPSENQPPPIAWLDAVQFNNAIRDRSAWRRVEAQLRGAVDESGWSWVKTPAEPAPSKDCESSIACLIEHAKASGVQYLLVTAGGYSTEHRNTDFSGSVRLFHLKEGFVSEEEQVECIVCGQSVLVQRLEARVKELLSAERQRIEAAATLAQARAAQPVATPVALLPPVKFEKPSPKSPEPSANRSNTLAWSSIAVGAVTIGWGVHWLLINSDRTNECGVKERTCGVYSTGFPGLSATLGGAALLGVGAYLLNFHNDSVSVSLQLSPQGAAINGAF
jgi:hypothetical protein